MLDALYLLKEAYAECICETAKRLHSGEERLEDGDNACFTRELVSGLKSTLMDIGMLEGDENGYAWTKAACAAVCAAGMRATAGTMAEAPGAGGTA